MRKLLLLSLILQICFFELAAQVTNLKIEHVLPKHGLSIGSVNCLLQDRAGYMWFGTSNGLNRYDGYSIEKFEHDPYNSNSLSDNYIRALYEDLSGTIWIATKKGLNKYNKHINKFTLFEHNSTYTNSISDNDIMSIYEDRSGVLWIGTRLGLNKYDRTTNTFTLYEHSPTHSKAWIHNTIHTIYEDRRGILWVGTSLGLSKFDRDTEKFTRYKHYAQSEDTLAFVTSIIEDRSGILWVGTMGDGLKQFDRDKLTFKVYTHDLADINSISSNRILSLYEDSFGILWVGHQHTGLDRFNIHTGKFSHYTYNENNDHSLRDNTITSLREDRSQVLWIGTFVGGISKINLLKKKIDHYKHDQHNDSSLKHNFVMALYQDRFGTTWVGNMMGVDKFIKQTGTFIHYPYASTLPDNLSFNNAHCIYEDTTANLWIGLGGGGLKRLNPKTKKVISYMNNPKDTTSLPDNHVLSIYEDKKGTLWIGTRGGISKFDNATEKFTTYKHPYPGPYIEYILEEPSGLLWLATALDGLVAFDPVDKKFTRYPINIKRLSAISNKTVNYIYKSRNGVLWLSLDGGGLYSFDRHSSTYKSASQQLSKILINGILEDDKGNLWLSTKNSGIYKYNPISDYLQNYDENDGLQSNEFNRALCKGTDGEMYFAGNNGFNVFHPDSLQANLYAPQVEITSFKVFDQPRFFSKQAIVLPDNENFFSFDFVAFSYTLPEKNRYAYKLENFDKGWIQSGSRRYASYTNIGPGTYFFKVKAANHDGIWNHEGASLKIIILPPWWQTTWAYLAYIALFAGFIYGFRQYTINREQLKNKLKLKSLESEKLKELDQIRSTFFTNISHEFRTPLTLIISPLEKLQSGKLQESKRNEYYKLMHRNANRLLHLINRLLAISKLEAKQMRLELQPGNITSFVDTHVFTFLSLAESKGIQLNFYHKPDNINTAFDKDKLAIILSNLLSNAFKFTPIGGKVTVSVTLKSSVDKMASTQWIQLQIEDNGIGIPADKIDKIFDRFYQADNSYVREFEGSGIGLTLTKELVELHGGKITVKSEIDKGTCFTILWPLIELSCHEIEHMQGNFSDEKVNFNWMVDIRAVDSHFPETAQSQIIDQAPLLLIVEDSVDVRAYIHSIFDSTYRILEAENGEEGLSKAKEFIPDLIISDWMMPKMDGVELCRKLKTDVCTSHIPVILLTAKATVENKIEGLETGADDYLLKPFHTDELMARVKNLIILRKKLREAFSSGLIIPQQSRHEVTCTPEIPTIKLSSVDKKFLQQLINFIDLNIANSALGMEELEKETGMSYTQLYRKVKAVTGQPPVDFLRDYRLQKAVIILSQKQINVSGAAYAVGFNNLSYFTKCFRQMYGMTPSEYIDNLNGQNKIEQV